MIEIKHLSKTFPVADGEVEALKDINLTIADGDIFGIIGMSGAGKSTLVRCINLLERPTEGTIAVNGVDLTELSPKALRAERQNITMIFQSFNLLMQRNCLRNVCFPLELIGMPKAKAVKRAMELLDLVGLADRAKSYPAQLSGGQCQRVAIARALATSPKVLLCDEPTSALDPNTTGSILDLIRDINEKLGITVVIITHQMHVIEDVCKNVAILENGTVVEEGPVSQVFMHPKSATAKRLFFPEDEFSGLSLNPGKGQRMIKLIFDGAQSADSPLIARMAIETGVAANILYARTKTVEGKTYGTMVLGVPAGEEAFQTAMNFISSGDNHVICEEVAENVQ